MKNKILTCCFLILGAKNMQAQEAVTSGGGGAGGSGGSVAYSLGQVTYISVSSASGSVNQGVQQAYDVIPTDINTHPGITLLASAYPNPSTAFINLKVENQDLQNLSFQLFDVQGKLLLNKKIISAETVILMDDFASGSYFLKVNNNHSELKTFKINKN